MIIYCKREGWVIDAVSVEIIRQTVTKGDSLQDRLANLETRPALRIKGTDDTAWKWMLPDSMNSKEGREELITEISWNAAHGIATSLPKGWTNPELGGEDEG